MILLLAITALSNLSAQALSIPDDPIAGLRPVHPRLLATPADFADLKKRIATDPIACDISKVILKQADALLKEPLPTYSIPDGKRLLATSRRVNKDIQTLGLAWQLTGDRKYPEHAWEELMAAGNFPDWNPAHFLDTAEMTRGFAVGLDWMNEAWTPSQREEICQWIIKKGLNPAMEGYKDPKSLTGKRLRVTHNWSQVTNGGIGMGALAIADLHPKEAREILKNALVCIQPSMQNFGPDGGWNEGYVYYKYAMEYGVALIASLQNSLGQDFGLSAMKGFGSTPDFPTYLEGPGETSFGFADCGEGESRIESIPEAGWVAVRFHNRFAAANQRQKALKSPTALGLLWLPPEEKSDAVQTIPRVKSFKANSYCTMRTSWGDTNAGFVGFKAGDNTVNHAHLDIGTFVYGSKGKYWAIDLGCDNYNLPEYFGKERWNYYRLRAEGHNTLTVNPGAGPDQPPTANCPITACKDRTIDCVAIADLGAAYPDLNSAKRGMQLGNDGNLRIQDEIDAGDKDTSVSWFMHTPAHITISPDGRSATLALEGETLRAHLLFPPDSRFEQLEPSASKKSPNPPGQSPNKGITKLAIRTKIRGKQKIIVDLIPAETKAAGKEVVPLEKW